MSLSPTMGSSMEGFVRPLAKLFRTRYILYFLTCAAITAGIATYFSITQSSSPFGPDPDLVLGLVLVDLVLLLLITVILSRKIIGLWLANKRGVTTGSRIQSRIILMFSLGATIPTIIIAIFSALFFNFGIQSWFDKKVSMAIEESVLVAEAYLKEHEKLLLADTTAMAGDLSRSVGLIISDNTLFEKMVVTQTAIRSLSEAMVFWHDKDQEMGPFNFRVIAKGRLSFALSFERPKQEDIIRAASGEPVLIQDPDGQHVRALVKLGNIDDTYLIAGRVIDAKVIEHMQNSQGGATQYANMKARISDIQIKFSFIFVLVALLLLFAALLMGMTFANYLVSPIRQLMQATERVKEGNLKTSIAIKGPNHDEFATLGKAFNDMTLRLEQQRDALVEANHQIDLRRRFSETVLSGVTAGVIGLTDQFHIATYNPRAKAILAIDQSLLTGHIVTAFPEISPLIEQAKQNDLSEPVLTKEIILERDSKKTTLNVRLSIEIFEDTVEGYVVTFDDITNLVSAQRSAAWRDVARRIAHEIKNPLTPIQLAAERLRRKYMDQLESPEDQENFKRYVDTITHHVGNIGTMVEEFVSFSRMPRPEFHQENLVDIIKEVVFAMRHLNENVHYSVDLPTHHVPLLCDKNQINQIFTNLIKNATESIMHSESNNAGNIAIVLVEEEKNIIVTIDDNGAGFLEGLIDRATEPYVTNKSKGTGLGLAIVKKIAEDHDAVMDIENLSVGARVTLVFKKVSV